MKRLLKSYNSHSCKDSNQSNHKCHNPLTTTSSSSASYSKKDRHHSPKRTQSHNYESSFIKTDNDKDNKLIHENYIDEITIKECGGLRLSATRKLREDKRISHV